ncbi:MAG: c-type cytochrome [Nitrospirota bacterium]
MKLNSKLVMLILGAGCFAIIYGCVATRADDAYQRKRAEARQRAAEPMPEAPNLTGVDQEIVRQGKILFNGKAVCFNCHGTNGDIRQVSNPAVLKLNPSPTDLREPSDKTTRQLELIIKYGIPETGMVAMQETLGLRDQDVTFLISYLLALRGQARPLSAIHEELSTASTSAEIVIYKICDDQALGDTSMKDACEHRLQRRHHDILIGRPPDIPTARYAEIQTSCGEKFGNDLDDVTRCYRLEYGITRQRMR